MINSRTFQYSKVLNASSFLWLAYLPVHHFSESLDHKSQSDILKEQEILLLCHTLPQYTRCIMVATQEAWLCIIVAIALISMYSNLVVPNQHIVLFNN